jgi:hypothetical protein
MAVLVSGAPLPITWIASLAPPAATEENAERYPCESCPCGCGTAQRCWTNCCCHTMSQRLAWARREGVRPPEEVLDQVAKAGLDVSPWREVSATKHVRLATTPATLPACCIRSQTAQPKPACCAAKTSKSSDRSKQKQKSSAPGVSLVQALACQGLIDAWLSIGEAVITTQFEWHPTLVVTPASTFYPVFSDRSAPPPVPPPPETRATIVG